MNYRVILQSLAANDLEDAYRYAAAKAPFSANRWLDRFGAVLKTLATNPDRCPLAREATKLSTPVRELLFGKRPYVFRVLYVIDLESVRVLRILRAQRRDLSTEEIQSSLEDE